MLRFFRRLWFKFELWNQNYCLKHLVKQDYEYWHGCYTCPRCLVEDAEKKENFRRERQERNDAMIKELGAQ